MARKTGFIRENPYFAMARVDGLQRGSRTYSEYVIYKKHTLGLIEVHRKSAGGPLSEARVNTLFDKISVAAAKRVKDAIPSHNYDAAGLL
jgi:hypothetical protein